MAIDFTDKGLAGQLRSLAKQIDDDGLRELIGYAKALIATSRVTARKPAEVLLMAQWRESRDQ